MSYKNEVLDKLRDSDKWPAFERPDFLATLNELADKSFGHHTVDGYLAALLIYHQLCEECTKLLINSSTFFIQLSVFPQEVREKDLNRKMFGELIKELEHLPLDKDTKEYLKKCKEFNQLRIKMVHKLTITTSITEISKNCKKVKDNYEEIFWLFDSIYDRYRLTFKDFEKNIEVLESVDRI